MSESPLQQIVCCLGQAVAGNPTQYVMEKAFAAAGLDWRCLTVEVAPERLGDAIRGMRALGFRGAWIAPPYKTAVGQHLDRLDRTAELAGVVNCVVIEDDSLVGENTEGKGLVQALGQVTGLAGKQVTILGAGSVVRSIAAEVARVGPAQLTIVNRTLEAAQQLADRLHEQLDIATTAVAWDTPYEADEQCEVLIHATPIGQGDTEAAPPVAFETLRPPLVVADVVYNPVQTALLQQAAQRGCTTLDGLAMLICQAVMAFQRWTGSNPDPIVMREALEEYLEV